MLRLLDIAYSFEPADAARGIDECCQSLPEDSGANGEWVRADIEEHVRDEHSTFTWILEPMIERCGFRIERVDHSDDGIFAAYVARAV